MVDPKLREAIPKVAAALNAADAKYALIGGLAFGARVRPRATKDADFIVQCPALRLAGLFERLKNDGFELDVLEMVCRWQSDKFIVLWREKARIDWMQPILPLYSAVVDSAGSLAWESEVLKIASTEGLILTKMLSFRLQDQADLEALVESNSANLDIAFIRAHWAPFAAGEIDRTAWLEAKLGIKLT